MTCANCGHSLAAHKEDSAERRSAGAKSALSGKKFALANCLIYRDAPYVPFSEQPAQATSQAGQGKRKWKPYRTPQMFE